VVDANTTDEDHAVAGNVLTNDTDVDTGDTRTVTEVNGVGANVGNQIPLASGALLTVNAGGSYTYDPNGMFEHLGAGQMATESFTYQTTDSQGASSTATVNVTITGVDDAPASLKVAVIGSNATAVADTVAQLNDSSVFSIDADGIALSSYSDADAWSAELASYDVVVVGSSGSDASQFDSSQLFSALRGFVDAGGGVVTTGWFAHALNLMTVAAADADYVSPVFDPDPVNQFNFTFSMRDTAITVLDPGHAITQGTTYDVGDVAMYDVVAGYHEQAAAIDPTATQLAWGPNAFGMDDAAAIAYDHEAGVNDDARTVYLGNLYLADPANPDYDTEPLRSGTSDQLLEQAVAWAGGSDEDAGGLQLTDFAADVIL
jgi:VCBS repeat-containing protein